MSSENDERSETALDISEDAFAALVEEVLAQLPESMLESIDNVAIFVAEEPEDGSDLLGLYEGVDLTERGDYGFGDLPDQITLFRLPLLRMCADMDELRREIQVTIVHEVAHHFGIDDDQLHELGWA
ncbi:metallopeptidase family protein [Actinomyces sp. S4-C9]|uniref:metallopeptidase family protein n=1 Tax=Actinomyces sp. S4-C9 TaxID=1219581 RepID=UPI00068C792D|nr:metallopeptidase family protein [Actinomyces sp. S4-C9]